MRHGRDAFMRNLVPNYAEMLQIVVSASALDAVFRLAAAKSVRLLFSAGSACAGATHAIHISASRAAKAAFNRRMLLPAMTFPICDIA